MNRRGPCLGTAALIWVFASGCSGDGGGTPEPRAEIVGIALSPFDSLARVGRQFVLNATYVDANGDPVPGGGFTWYLGPNVVRSPDGVVTPLAVGDVMGQVSGRGHDLGIYFTVLDSFIANRTIVLGNPFGVAVSGTKAYVTQPEAGALAVLDVSSSEMVGSIPVGSAAYPREVAFSPDGLRAYVANLVGTLTIINASQDDSVGLVDLPGSLLTALPSVNGQTIWAASETGGTSTTVVYAVDASTFAVLDSATGFPPEGGMARHPALGHLYLGTGTYQQGAPNLFELDAVTLDTLRTWSLGGNAQHLAVSPDGGELYVANTSGTLQFLSLATGLVVATPPISGGGRGMALSPDGTTLAVSTGVGRVDFYDVATRLRGKRVTVGGNPQGVAYRADGQRVLVANEYRWVDFIR